VFSSRWQSKNLIGVRNHYRLYDLWPPLSLQFENARKMREWLGRGAAMTANPVEGEIRDRLVARGEAIFGAPRRPVLFTKDRDAAILLNDLDSRCLLAGVMGTIPAGRKSNRSVMATP
jgi:hypothetical protein